MALHGLAWPCMALHGLAWHCMVMYGIVLSFIALYGLFMGTYRFGLVWSFFTVIDSNSFGLVIVYVGMQNKAKSGFLEGEIIVERLRSVQFLLEIPSISSLVFYTKKSAGISKLCKNRVDQSRSHISFTLATIEQQYSIVVHREGLRGGVHPPTP